MALDKEKKTKPSSEPTGGFDLGACLDKIAHFLPAQSPIKDFIHHNTLHAFQEHPFDEAVDAASRFWGAYSYLPLRTYQHLFHQGDISPSILEKILEEELPEKGQQAQVRELCTSPTIEEPGRPVGLLHRGIRNHWNAQLDRRLDNLVLPLLFRMTANYLDQGIALDDIPFREKGLWMSLQALARESWISLPPLHLPPCRDILDLTPEQAIHRCLQELVGDSRYFETYLQEMLLASQGWAGMVNVISKNPGAINYRRSISLMEWTAVAVTLELGFLQEALGKKMQRLFPAKYQEPPVPPPPSMVSKAQAVFQRALERTYYSRLLNGLVQNLEAPGKKHGLGPVHAVFCLDDREGGLRRHLEEIDPSIFTWSTAGFFGVDFMFQGEKDNFPIQRCPVVLKPKHLIREVRDVDSTFDLNRYSHLHPSSHGLIPGWLFTQTLGWWAALRLMFRVFLPTWQPIEEKALSEVEEAPAISLLRTQEQPTDDGYLLGYSISEMADRVEDVLTTMGFTQNFPELIVMVAHGSSSANNPHFSAYDCGACSGKPGGPNARAFAEMANNRVVREELSRRGFELPEGTCFLGAMHDTTADTIRYYENPGLSPRHRELLESFQRTMAEALSLNAKERCRRFELVPLHVTPKNASKIVKGRAQMIFEPRPELNHATNASCIIGRRKLTRGLFLDRRAFIQSYNPELDQNGHGLRKILGAVIPVCGGINLEYYFSRIDPEVYGAGTKLPHNVASLLGVSNGVDSDLRTGLPTQMTELHDPVRLMIVIEQDPTIVLKVLQGQPALLEWVRNQWVQIACIHPKTLALTHFHEDTFKTLVIARESLEVHPNSLSVISDRRGNICPALIREKPL